MQAILCCYHFVDRRKDKSLVRLSFGVHGDDGYRADSSCMRFTIRKRAIG